MTSKDPTENSKEMSWDNPIYYRIVQTAPIKAEMRKYLPNSIMFLFIYLQVKPLIWIESVIERHAHSRIEFMVKAKSQFKRRSTANNVEIIIPVPNDADSPKFKTTIGHCKYEPETQSIKWTIKSFPGKLW